LFVFPWRLRFSAGAIKEAATHFIECRESYRELDLRKEEAQCLLKLSRCSAFLRNEPDFSSEQTFLDEALVLAKDTGEKGLEVECLVLLGASLRHEQADLAMSKYAEALKLIEAEKNNWLSGICHQSLGHLYAGQTDNWTARKHYLQALSHFEECSAEDATLLAQKQANAAKASAIWLCVRVMKTRLKTATWRQLKTAGETNQHPATCG